MQEFIPLVRASEEAVKFGIEQARRIENNSRAPGVIGRLTALALAVSLAGMPAGPEATSEPEARVCITDNQCLSFGGIDQAAGIQSAIDLARNQSDSLATESKDLKQEREKPQPIERSIDEMRLTLDGFINHVASINYEYQDDAARRTAFNPKRFNNNGGGVRIDQSRRLVGVGFHHTADRYDWDKGEAVAIDRLLTFMNNRDCNPRSRNPKTDTSDACSAFHELIRSPDAQPYVFADRKARLAHAGHPILNSKTYGIEGEALNARDMEPEVLEAMVYSGIRVLLLEGILDVRKVETQFQGHAEMLDRYRPGDKVDFPAPVMNRLRRKQILPFLKANIGALKDLTLTNRSIVEPVSIDRR